MLALRAFPGHQDRKSDQMGMSKMVGGGLRIFFFKVLRPQKTLETEMSVSNFLVFLLIWSPHVL